MFVLWRHSSMPIQELAQATGLGKSTLTSMLDRLEAAGHISRAPSAEDRRQTMVAASAKSIAHMERYVQVSKDMNELFYRGFAPGEINDFEAFLHRILTNLSGSR
jgi:DNA-binding MarR family transcriptional regulator